MTRFLRPAAFCEAARREGIEVTPSTLATKRNRSPEAIPFRKVGGRIYYRWPESFDALVGEPQTESVAAAGGR